MKLRNFSTRCAGYCDIAGTTFGKSKNVQNLARFWQLSTLFANISGTYRRVENRKSKWSTKPLPRW